MDPRSDSSPVEMSLPNEVTAPLMLAATNTISPFGETFTERAKSKAVCSRGDAS
jgi:hypothetical protein